MARMVVGHSGEACNLFLQCSHRLQLALAFYPIRGNVHGVEYITAIPARKSRARPFPPVAEAAYGPYAAIMLVVSCEVTGQGEAGLLVNGRHVD